MVATIGSLSGIARHAKGNGGFNHQVHSACQKPHTGNGSRGGKGYPSQAAAQPIQSFLKGGCFFPGIIGQLRNAAQLSFHAGFHHHTFTGTLCNGGTLKQHGSSFSQRRTGCNRFALFQHGKRLAGEGGFIDFQIVGLQQTNIGRREITGFQNNDVSRYKFFRIDLHFIAVAPYPYGVAARSLTPPIDRMAFHSVTNPRAALIKSTAAMAIPSAQCCRTNAKSGDHQHDNHHAFELFS